VTKIPDVPPLLKYTLIGMVAAALAVGLAIWGNRGWQVRLEVAELKARTVGTDENSSILILELRLKNPAQTPFVVRQVRASVLAQGGARVEGKVVSELDLDRVLEYYKHLGPRYNPTLKARERLAGGAQIDRTVAASFAVAEAALNAREGVAVEIEDVDGVVVNARLR
jgi:hypothetical protein